MLFINLQRCFCFTICVIKNSNIVLSAISCRSGNGGASAAAEQRHLALSIHWGRGEGRGVIGVSIVEGERTKVVFLRDDSRKRL